MYAHTFEDVEKYSEACDKVFAKLSKLISEDRVEEKLEGLPATSGFERIN